MEEAIPDYQKALDSLPEEPSPVTLPALMRRFFQTDAMDAEEAEDPLVTPPTTEVAAETVTETAAGTYRSDI